MHISQVVDDYAWRGDDTTLPHFVQVACAIEAVQNAGAAYNPLERKVINRLRRAELPAKRRQATRVYPTPLNRELFERHVKNICGVLSEDGGLLIRGQKRTRNAEKIAQHLSQTLDIGILPAHVREAQWRLKHNDRC